MDGPAIWTIGHSTRSADVFLELLLHDRLEAIADVRRFPASRRQPQYAKSALRAMLQEHGIEYHWLPRLGGRRRPVPHSPNVAWRNASFRGYADYIDTPEFSRGLAELIDISTRVRTAVMCAEAMWWHCHRALIADVLVVRGLEVRHILGMEHTAVHPLTSPARIVDGRLTYVQPSLL